MNTKLNWRLACFLQFDQEMKEGLVIEQIEKCLNKSPKKAVERIQVIINLYKFLESGKKEKKK